MLIARRCGCLKKVLLTLFVIPGLLLFTNLMTFETLYFLHFMYPLNNVRHIVDEIERNGFTSTQPFNNITKQYGVIKDPSKAFCGSNSQCEHFDMVYIVKSYIANFEQRMAIRKTWGTDKTLSLKTLFVVGYSEDRHNLTDMESNTYQDIIQFDIIDIYRNLVYKTIFSIIWLVDRKIQTRYVHFLDDDRIVNTLRLHQFAKANLNKSDLKMIGHRLVMTSPNRDKSSKHYISKDEYPYHFWPPYLIGGTILTNMKVVNKMAMGIPYVKIIAIEDVFIGILSKLLHIGVIHNSGFLPYFQPGYNLKYKLSSPNYKSYTVMIKNWRHIHTYNLYLLNRTDNV